MSLLTRIARATALTGLLLATPALAENKKVTLSQAFQSMLYLPLYVAIDEGFFTQQGLDLTKDTDGRALGRDFRKRAIFDPWP
jgi:NitT/TauT family transport system substrate-binding protein